MPLDIIHLSGILAFICVAGDACNNGQAQYWYSQGCFIGCKECDHKSGRRQIDLCKSGFVGQLPDFAIAVNRNSSSEFRNSEYDIYRHNPWRAPGHAPIADACGLAGGTPWGGKRGCAHLPDEPGGSASLTSLRQLVDAEDTHLTQMGVPWGPRESSR